MSQTNMSTESSYDAAPQLPMLCVSIHDVAPATWSDCLRLVQAVRAVADIPLTWLVVPHYHFRPENSPAMEACLDVALDRGDELALHGYSHLDTEANGGGLRNRFLRNVYTRREGEFAALSEAEARRRLELGLDWFAERGWTPSGFVPPAWLLGEGAWRALRNSPFTYTTTFSHFHCLPGPHDTWGRPVIPRRLHRRDRRDRRSQFEGGQSLQQAQGGYNRQGEAQGNGGNFGGNFGSNLGSKSGSKLGSNFGGNAGGTRPWEQMGSQGLQMPAGYQGGHAPGDEHGGAHADRRDRLERERQGRLDLRTDELHERARAAAARRHGPADAEAAAAAAATAAAATSTAAAARPDMSAAGSVIAHPGRALLSPSLVYAARNRSGRLLSPRVADVTAAMLANSPLVRFSLHPPDARYPELVRHIQQVLERLLTEREAVTKAECARRLVAADGFAAEGFTSTDPTSRSDANSLHPSHSSQAT